MKKLFFLALPLLLFSCKGVEQYRSGIEELAGNWDSTTKTITDLSGSLSSDLSKYTNSFAAIQPDEAELNALKPEQKEAIISSRDAVVEALKGYPVLQKKVKGFVDTWTEKSAMVTALKDGLAAGKIEGDVTSQLSELSGLITTGNENIEAWTGTHKTLQVNLQSAMTKFSTAMGALAPMQ